MPQNSIKDLQWEHRFAAIFKCSSKSAKPDEIAVVDSQAIAANENLVRVLKALQHDLIFKQIYQNAKMPTTRFLPFRQNQGNVNEAHQLLNELIAANDAKVVEQKVIALAKKYMKTKYVQNGLLIFLTSTGKLNDETEGTCAFVFKCDFEDISQLSSQQNLFRKIDDAIVEKTKKGTLYPYYSQGKFDDSTVRVFDELGETQYWLDFLDLGEPVVTGPQLQAVTLDEWEQVKPGVAGKYEEQLAGLTANRSLVKKELFADAKDQLTLSQTDDLINAVVSKTGKQNVSLKLDQAKLTVSLDEFGKTWIVAEQAGTQFIILKGSELRMRTGLFNPIDIASRPSVKDALEKLDLPV